MLLDVALGSVDWFSNAMAHRMSGGSGVEFQKDKWHCGVALTELFSRFYLVAINKDSIVANMGTIE